MYDDLPIDVHIVEANGDCVFVRPQAAIANSKLRSNDCSMQRVTVCQVVC